MPALLRLTASLVFEREAQSSGRVTQVAKESVAPGCLWSLRLRGLSSAVIPLGATILVISFRAEWVVRITMHPFHLEGSSGCLFLRFLDSPNVLARWGRVPGPRGQHLVIICNENFLWLLLL